MASRPAILATLLGASIGVPYVVSQATGEGEGDGRPNAPPAAQADSTGHSPSGLQNPAALAGTPIYPLAQVMRLDVTKEWVYARWPRKTTGLADPELFGVRVPLVTGTSTADLAGSLSYYFDHQGHVQHISFRGNTGSPAQIVQLVTSQYGFRPVPGDRPGEQMYQVLHNGKVQSELRILPASVLRSTTPHQSFVVELELERPGSNRYIQRPLPLLSLPSSNGQIEPLQGQPPKPVPVGPATLFQSINNGLHTTVEAASSVLPSGASQSAASSSSTTVELPRPQVHWPN